MDQKTKYRHCLCCGEKNTIETNLMSCKKCGYEFYLNPASATGCVLVVDNKILLVKRAREPKKDTWDLPGGFVETGESAEEALKREVLEELGVEIKEIKYINSVADKYEYSGVIENILVINYLAKPVSMDFHPKDDVSEFKLFDMKDIPYENIGFESIKITLRLVERNLLD